MQVVLMSDKIPLRSIPSAIRKLAPDIPLRSIGLRCRAVPHSLRGITGEVSKTRNSFSPMPNKSKRSGRPLKSDSQRTKKITVRFTEDEYKTISELEETLGISKTDLVRQRLLHGARLTIINAKEMIAGLNVIGAELGRSGNNINQLARYANTLNKQGVLSPQIAEQFNTLFSSHLDNRKALDTALRKIMLALGR